MKTSPSPAELPWAGWLKGLKGTGGRLKTVPEDFLVREIPAYEPVGEGEFIYLWVSKRDLSADRLRKELARALGISSRDVGMAGLKDRRAVTWQWVSVPQRANPAQQGLCADGWVVLRAVRHRNKLRPGHLHGNQFILVVRDARPGWQEFLRSLSAKLKTHGMPNAYGAQRFGNDRQTLALGLSLLDQPKLAVNPWLRRLALSAVQSHVFNSWLQHRLEFNTLRQVMQGEIMAHAPRGGIFTAVDLPAEQKRLDAGQIVPAGPIPGSRMLPARDQAAALENTILQQLELTRLLEGQKPLLTGTRRRALVYPNDLTWHPAPAVNGYRLEFSLPEGSYATVLAGILMEGEKWQGPEVGVAQGMDEAGEEGLTEGESEPLGIAAEAGDSSGGETG